MLWVRQNSTMRTLIQNAQIINEGTTAEGNILIDGEHIAEILSSGQQPDTSADTVIDASGCYIMPGVIDTHVHFREPGLTAKADTESESRAAAAGGVTSYLDMPNTAPQTTTLETLAEKFARAAQTSHVNYSFFFGATNDNVGLFDKLDPHTIPGIKLFMGSSTGNMLVDNDDSLRRLFASTSLPIMAHCEDTAIIERNMADAIARYGDDPSVEHHPEIRSAEACYASTAKAVALARQSGARLHVAHLTTERELALFGNDENITAEACVGHLLFTADDHKALGALIKVNPAIKGEADREALRRALTDGRIYTVATDHAPHLLSQKQGGCRTAASGMPMIQFSLPTMLELTDQGVLSKERMVELMCHNPALLFGIRERGFIRKGYKADLTIVRPDAPWRVTEDIIESKCGWSPVLGMQYNWRVERTICNGHTIYNNVFAEEDAGECSGKKGCIDNNYIGQALLFR